MKKLLRTLVFVLLGLLILSCEKEEVSSSNQEYLYGTWTIKKSKTYNYTNGELDITVEEREEPFSKLSFEADGVAFYHTPGMSAPVNGFWLFREDFLKTGFQQEVSGPNNIMFFLPIDNIVKIVEVDEKQLVVTSKVTGAVNENYTETFLEK